MKYTERKLKEEIEIIKKGCGINIGVPLFMKFKPCGENYKGKHYFCEHCERRLVLLKNYFYYYKLGKTEASKK